MRKFIIFVPLILLIISGKMQAQNVTIEGKQFKINGRDTFIMVCNYAMNIVYNTSDPNNYFISPEHSYGSGIFFECNSDSTCKNKVLNDFLQLRQMKFNTVRIVGLNPSYFTLNGITGFHKRVYDQTLVDKWITLQNPYNDTNSLALFKLIDKMLILADSAGLKVILLGCDKDSIESHLPPFYNDYPFYLKALSGYIKNNCSLKAKNALLAYDLYNEPTSSNSLSHWPVSKSIYHTKSFICQQVRSWYDTLKTYDPDHLVTIGVHGMPDVLEWDMATFKLDFLSPHLYPLPTRYDDTSKYANALNRVLGEIYWLGKNCPMPWIIGEIGLSAGTGFNYPDVDGTLAEQKDFAEKTLLAVKASGGSGYSWWQYQNVFWETQRQSNFGLLYTGNCEPPCSTLYKPVVEAFINFDSNAPVTPITSPPPNYYDPFVHMQFDTIPSHYIHGHIKDQDEKPISDAYVFAQTQVNVAPPDTFAFDNHFTFTNDSGDYLVVPLDVDSVNSIRTKFIVNMFISAAGAERTIRGQWWNAPKGVVNNDNIQLSRTDFKYNGSIQNKTITSSASNTILSGWSTLTLGQGVSINDVSGNITARNEIHLTDGFELHSGHNSEVHIFNAETYPECPCFAGYSRLVSNNQVHLSGYNETSILNETKELELGFKLKKGDFFVSAYPNPSSGVFLIDINSSDETRSSYNVIIINASGSHIQQMVLSESKFSLDLSKDPPGVYYLKVFNDKKSKIFKLINL